MMKKIFLTSLLVLTIVFGLNGNTLAQVCNFDPNCDTFMLSENCVLCPLDCPSPGPGYKCDPVVSPWPSTGWYIPLVSCGDGFCSFLPIPGETCGLCPFDCPCDPGYKCDPAPPLFSNGCYIPPFDCTDNFCSYLTGEDCNLCATDCACPADRTCAPGPGADDHGCILTCNNDGTCDHTAPGVEDCTNCFDCDCGAGTCDSIDPGANPDTGCIPPCGDGICQSEENCAICSWDCPCPGGYSCDPVVGCVPPPTPPDEGLDPPINATTFEELIYDITNTIFYFALILGPILFLIAGFYFITAGENPSRVARAKYIAGWTTAGILVILIAKGIIEAIKAVMGTI